MKKLFAATVIVIAVFAAIAGSVTLLATTSTPVMAKCGNCPYVCLQVRCDGRTYCNSCFAACAGAHNCTGGGGV
jgi:hypothetical protein